MQPVLTVLPELEPVGDEAVAAPELGSLDLTPFELRFERAHAVFQLLA